jgi:hypothetical protein
MLGSGRRPVGEKEKSEASFGVTGSASPRIGGERQHLVANKMHARGRTGSSPAHPFGSLATTGPMAEGP